MNVTLDKKTIPVYSVLVLFLCLCCTLNMPSVYAQQAPVDNTLNSAAYECTQVKIDEVDPTLLTRAERVKRMEMNLHESIDGYATCMTSVQKSMAAGGQGQGGGEGNGKTDADVSSETDASQSSEATANNSSTQDSEITSTKAQTIKQPRGLIKPKDNDAIICRLLWDEIQKASADKRTGFEKQYAEYKCG